MTKQELAHVARLMYDVQESCKEKRYCDGCPAKEGLVCRIKLMGADDVPANWHITKADIERLERESNDE